VEEAKWTGQVKSPRHDSQGTQRAKREGEVRGGGVPSIQGRGLERGLGVLLRNCFII